MSVPACVSDRTLATNNNTENPGGPAPQFCGRIRLRTTSGEVVPDPDSPPCSGARTGAALRCGSGGSPRRVRAARPRPGSGRVGPSRVRGCEGLIPTRALYHFEEQTCHKMALWLLCGSLVGAASLRSLSGCAETRSSNTVSTSLGV